MLMKPKRFIPILLLAALPWLGACSDDDEEVVAPDGTEVPETPEGPDASMYPVPDDAVAFSLRETPQAVQALLGKMDPARALVMGETEITDSEFAEIKDFVDRELKKATGKETYDAIFGWITNNIKVASRNEVAYLKPYDVFTHKTCICQGFANLLKTMMITQDIPALCVNGYLGNAGHAWNYVYVDNKWYVSDPTNKMQFAMEDVDQYKRTLIPQRLDLNLFEDGNFAYNYDQGRFNVAQVLNTTAEVIAIPYSMQGFVISSFYPSQVLPDTLHTIYLGRNIEVLAPYPPMFSDCTPALEAVYVDPENPVLTEHKGIIYQGNNPTPYYVPTAMKRVEIRPMERMEKNTLVDLPNVEEVVIPEGVAYMDNYAIEALPALKRLYLPSSLRSMATFAVYRCSGGYEVVRAK